MHELYMIQVFVEPSATRGGDIHRKKKLDDPGLDWLVTVQRERAKAKQTDYERAESILRRCKENFVDRGQGSVGARR